MKATIPLADLTKLLNALEQICCECDVILESDQNPNKGTINRIRRIASHALRENQ